MIPNVKDHEALVDNLAKPISVGRKRLCCCNIEETPTLCINFSTL